MTVLGVGAPPNSVRDVFGLKCLVLVCLEIMLLWV